jgi:hypothetical protein
MVEINDSAEGFERALAMVPSCALDGDGRRSQKARYNALAQSVSGVRREPEVLFVEFGERVDRALLEEVIAVERVCCPFFQFEFDPTARQLAVTTVDPAMLPALDAIEFAFAGALR